MVLQCWQKGKCRTMRNIHRIMIAFAVALLGLLIVRVALISVFFVLAVAVRITIALLLSGTQHSKNLA